MQKRLLSKRFGILLSILAASFGNYVLNIMESYASKNLLLFADFSTTFLIYITILAANRSIFAEGIRSNIFLGFQAKSFMNCLFENALVLTPISLILIFFGNDTNKILGILLIPLILHDNMRYMFINENKIPSLLKIDSFWTILFLFVIVLLHLTKELSSLSVFFGWAFPTFVTVGYFVIKSIGNFERSDFLTFPWMRANIVNIRYSAIDYLFGSGLAQILILLSVLYGQSIDSSSLRISQLLLFPLITLLTVENLEKNDKSKFRTPPKILLQHDFNFGTISLLSVIVVSSISFIAPLLLNMLIPEPYGFNYSILYSYSFYVLLNSLLIPYLNTFKNMNNYQIIQESRKYYLGTLAALVILGGQIPELDRLILVLGISTIPMILRLEKERRRLLE